jgi:hypothetical protein
VTSDALGPGPGEPDSEGCLLLVASYADVAPVIRGVAEDAASRIMMSPTLGDFIELRFVDLGPRPVPASPTEAAVAPPETAPAQKALHNSAVAVIADALTLPCGGAGRNYFALVVADRSATTAGTVLDGCAADPVIAALPLRCLGLASVDDRLSAPESGLAQEVTVSPTGSWTSGDLVDELRRYGERLLNDFATGYERGLTAGELSELRSRSRRDTPDVLAPQEPAEHEQEHGGDGAEHETKPPEPPLPRPAQLSPLPPMSHQPPLPPPSQEEPGPVPLVPRSLRPLRPWRRHPFPASRSDGSSHSGATVGPARLVYMILAGDKYVSDRASWRRGRSVLLELDDKLAARPGVACHVRVLQAAQDAARGALQPAGQLRSRDIKRPTGYSDFSSTLDGVHAALRRDLAALARSAEPTAGTPAIIFFVLDAPLADAIATREYAELARDASIIWVVPEGSADLLSPIFTERARVSVITDHVTVADEVIDLLGDTAQIEQADTDNR